MPRKLPSSQFFAAFLTPRCRMIGLFSYLVSSGNLISGFTYRYSPSQRKTESRKYSNLSFIFLSTFALTSSAAYIFSCLKNPRFRNGLPPQPEHKRRERSPSPTGHNVRMLDKMETWSKIEHAKESWVQYKEIKTMAIAVTIDFPRTLGHISGNILFLFQTQTSKRKGNFLNSTPRKPLQNITFDLACNHQTYSFSLSFQSFDHPKNAPG